MILQDPAFLAIAGGLLVLLLLVIAALVRRMRARRSPVSQPPLRSARVLNLQRTVLAVAPLVDQSVARLRESFAARGLELIVETHDAGLRANADASRLEQALGFLLDNTLRHADAPGPVRIAVRRSGGYVSVMVADAGPSVPKMALSRLFDRDYRTDVARTRVAGDNRLGLSICRTIVEAHGGSIEASPSAAGGLQIEILLPLRA